MTYSEWQSGAIAPTIDGCYQRRSALQSPFGDQEGNHIALARFSATSQLWRYYADDRISVWQTKNGHLWQWRGLLDA